MARDPLDPAAWPAAGLEAPRALIDDLWAKALSRLAELARGPHLALAAARAPLLGAGLQPWHAVLAVASWLADLGAQGVPGLFDRLAELVRPAHSAAGAPASTDSAALALQAFYVFAITLLGRLAKACNLPIPRLWPRP